MGNTQLIWMLATLCSVIANTSPDTEGKTFVYRKSIGGSSGGLSLPDPTMMRPEDFLPHYGREGAAEQPERHGGVTNDQAEQFIGLLTSRGAIDARKERRDGPRQA